MKYEDLNGLVQHAKAARSAPVTPDYERVWRRIQQRRSEGEGLHTFVPRFSLVKLAAAAALFVAGGSLTFLATRLFRGPVSFAESAPVRIHLRHAEGLLEAFRAEAASGGAAAGLAVVAGDLALVSSRLRARARATDASLSARLGDLDFVLSQIGSYEPARDSELRDLNYIEYSVRIRLAGADAPAAVAIGDVDASPSTLFVSGKRALAERDYQGAETHFRSVSDMQVPNEFSRPALYWLSYTLYQRGALEGNVNVMLAAKSAIDAYLRTDSSSPSSGDASRLNARIRVELATLGDPGAQGELGALMSAFGGLPRRSEGEVLQSLAAENTPLELRHQAVLAIAAHGDAFASRTLKSIAEGRGALPRQLRVASVRALAMQQLADAAYFENITMRVEDLDLRREMIAAAGVVRGLAGPVVAADTALPPRSETALTAAHADPTFELRNVVPAQALGGADVSAILADDAGNVYLADRRLKRIVVFDSTGKRVMSLGPAGVGPASFGGVAAVGWLADTLVVADDSARELVFLSRSGKPYGRRAWPIGIGPVAELVGTGEKLMGVGLSQGTGGVRRTYFGVSSRGLPDVRVALRDTMRVDARIECVEAARSVVHVLDAPFAPRGPLRAFTREGDLVLAQRDSLGLSVFSGRTGQQSKHFAASFDRAPVSEEVWQNETRHVRALEARVGVVECNPPLRRPVKRPAVASILSDERGRFWLEMNGPDGPRLVIVDPSHASVESVTMPPRDYGALPAVRGNKFYFAGRDAQGHPVISVYSRRY